MNWGATPVCKQYEILGLSAIFFRFLGCLNAKLGVARVMVGVASGSMLIAGAVFLVKQIQPSTP